LSVVGCPLSVATGEDSSLSWRRIGYRPKKKFRKQAIQFISQSEQGPMKLQQLCDAAGMSRQGFLKWSGQKGLRRDITPEAEVLELARRVRRLYLPGAGARELYRYIRRSPTLNEKLIGWGKHRFEDLCYDNGLAIRKIRFIPKTTQRGEFVFENLIAGMEIRDINQVLVSDICYVFGVLAKNE
jgi:hypothetical protein